MLMHFQLGTDIGHQSLNSHRGPHRDFPRNLAASEFSDQESLPN